MGFASFFFAVVACLAVTAVQGDGLGNDKLERQRKSLFSKADPAAKPKAAGNAEPRFAAGNMFKRAAQAAEVAVPRPAAAAGGAAAGDGAGSAATEGGPFASEGPMAQAQWPLLEQLYSALSRGRLDEALLPVRTAATESLADLAAAAATGGKTGAAKQASHPRPIAFDDGLSVPISGA
jgi:hypothetical protein